MRITFFNLKLHIVGFYKTDTNHFLDSVLNLTTLKQEKYKIEHIKQLNYFYH